MDKNFETAVKRDSDINGRYHFRKYFSKYLHGKNTIKDEWVSVSLLEFFEGNNEFSGLKSLIKAYIEINSNFLDAESQKLGYNLKKRILSVYNFYVARAQREIISNSRFIRNFVLKHKAYKHDSIVTDEIVTDLIDTLFIIQENDNSYELFGHHLQDL